MHTEFAAETVAENTGARDLRVVKETMKVEGHRVVGHFENVGRVAVVAEIESIDVTTWCCFVVL